MIKVTVVPQDFTPMEHPWVSACIRNGLARPGYVTYDSIGTSPGEGEITISGRREMILFVSTKANKLLWEWDGYSDVNEMTFSFREKSSSNVQGPKLRERRPKKKETQDDLALITNEILGKPKRRVK